MSHKKEALFDWNLTFRLFLWTVQAALVVGTIALMTQDYIGSGLLCFLMFLMMQVFGLYYKVVAMMRTFGQMLADYVSGLLISRLTVMPQPFQIDHVLRCKCDECTATRERFGLPDRVGQPCMLDAEEKMLFEQLTGVSPDNDD